MLQLMYGNVQHQPRPKQGLDPQGQGRSIQAKTSKGKAKTMANADAGILWSQAKTKA